MLLLLELAERPLPMNEWRRGSEVRDEFKL